MLRPIGIVKVLAFLIFAVPLLGQETRWEVDSDHSTARLVLSSAEKPAVQVNVGVARVSGTVKGTADISDLSAFNFTIYPADVADPGSEERADSRSIPPITVIRFKSRSVKEDGAKLQVTGELTVNYVERVANYDPSESYSGPVYGAPIRHSQKQELTFHFQEPHWAVTSKENAGQVQWRASDVIQGASFPQLLHAVELTNWPVLIEDESCETPSTTGEDFSGPKCTGIAVGITPRSDVRCEMPVTTGEDFAGEICTGTPLLTDSTDSQALSRGQSQIGHPLVANEMTIDLDLGLTRPKSTGSTNGAGAATLPR